MSQEAHDTISINYTGTMNACEALFPLLRSNGRVVHVTSRLGLLHRIKDEGIRKQFSDENNTIDDLASRVNDYIRLR